MLLLKDSSVTKFQMSFSCLFEDVVCCILFSQTEVKSLYLIYSEMKHEHVSSEECTSWEVLEVFSFLKKKTVSLGVWENILITLKLIAS